MGPSSDHCWCCRLITASECVGGRTTIRSAAGNRWMRSGAAIRRHLLALMRLPRAPDYGGGAGEQQSARRHQPSASTIPGTTHEQKRSELSLARAICTDKKRWNAVFCSGTDGENSENTRLESLKELPEPFRFQGECFENVLSRTKNPVSGAAPMKLPSRNGRGNVNYEVTVTKF